MQRSDYIRFYEAYKDMAEKVWSAIYAPDYEANVWYSHNRNRIALEMIANKWKGKRVLALGAAHWVDAALLEGIPCKSYLRTDLIRSEGIELACNACDLPFQDESFDAIVCREVIEHVLIDSELLWEARRVLKESGWLFITTPNGYNTPPDGMAHIRAYTPLLFLKGLDKWSFNVIEKRGNVPNIHHSLMRLEKHNSEMDALGEFKELAKIYDAQENSYYFGSEMFVLAQKNTKEVSA